MPEFINPNGSIALHSGSAPTTIPDDPPSPNAATPFGVRRTDASTYPRALADIAMFGAGTGNLQGVIALSTMNSGTAAGPLVERLRVHTNGNVGIGTAAPTQALDVAGTVKATAFQGDGSALTGIRDASRVSKAGDTMTGTLTLPANGLSVGAQLALANGRVGIGTATPQAQLHVVGGDTLLAGNLTVGAGGNGSLKLRHIDGKHWQNDDYDNLHLNWSTGKQVVVGSPGVAAGLVVYGSTSILGPNVAVSGSLTLGAGGNGSLTTRHIDGKHWQNDGFENLHLNWSTGKLVVVGSPGVPAGLAVHGGATVDGDVGIGTAAPKGKLHVAADMVVGRDLNNQKFIFHARLNGSGDFLHITHDKSDGGWEWGHGILLFRNGNTEIRGNFVNHSSREVKENIDALPPAEALRVVREMRPVTYRFKTPGSGRRNAGFIAEEMPDLVCTEDHDGILPVNVLAVVTRAVQLQQSAVDALEKRVAALASRRAAQRRRLRPRRRAGPAAP